LHKVGEQAEDKLAVAGQRELGHRLFRSLYRIRRVEEEIAQVYPSDKIKSPVHLSIGQEAVSVGVCEALSQEDVVFGTYRGHALYLAKGGDLNQMIAELYGKATGCAKGKGGSMHLVDTDCGMMGTSAVVATTIPNAVGYAMAMRYRQQEALVASFFGDGAVEEGVFWESLNFAVVKSLPVVFVCENNDYAIHSKRSTRQGGVDIIDAVKAHGLPAVRVEDNDVFALHELIGELAPKIRTGKSGPVFVECMTYRWREHVGPNEDFGLGYRDQSEAEPWVGTDQVERLAGIVGAEDRARIEGDVEGEIEQAFNFAETSPFPEASELLTDVYKG
jgi:TPP-dependent pyruvate/acetoin dehydrogenase alpha subunit